MQPYWKIFGSFIEKRRLEKGLMRKDLAKLLGCKNLGKCIAKIEKIERGFVDGPLISKINALLEISVLDWQKCQKEEKSLTIKDLASLPPFTPRIVKKVAPGIYVEISVPDNVEDLLLYASEFAKECKNELCVETARDTRYWFDTNGYAKCDFSFNSGPQATISFLNSKNGEKNEKA